ncbi:15071_t:CDS:1, partial [Racocetra persica]
ECNINIDSSEIIDSVKLSKSTNTILIQDSLNCSIIELTNNFGVNIYYHLKTDNDSSTLLL